jgi:cytochrome c553
MKRICKIVAICLSLLLLSRAAVTQSWAQTIDIAAGNKRAEVCKACHGDQGLSAIPGTPNLAGQDREYLANALRAYRGAQLRTDPTMTEMAKPLSDADIENLAAFWNSLARVGN